MAAATKGRDGMEMKSNVKQYKLSIAMRTVQMKDFGACNHVRHDEYYGI